MDVRCEKCHTEYELEESKVTEAGVTVKCTSCGNLFKIKRKSAAPPPRPPDPSGDSGSMWLIRSPGGENRRFRELTTLQQWIVERKVTRACEISRTGETWKKLGDIAELAAFFAIVDQAQAAARPPVATERKSTHPFASSTVLPARPPSMPVPPVAPASLAVTVLPLPASASEPEPESDSEPAEPLELEPDPPSNPDLPPASAYAPGPSPASAYAPPPAAPAAFASQPAPTSLPPASFATAAPALLGSAPLQAVSGDRPRGVPTAVVRRPEPQKRDSWAGSAAVPPAGEKQEPAWTTEPMAGARGPMAEDSALARSARGARSARTVRVDPSPFGGEGEVGDLDMLRRRRGSNAWLWITAVVVLGGGAAGWLLLRTPAAAEPVVAAGFDAGVRPGPGATVAAPTAGPDAGPAAAAAQGAQKKLQEALARLGDDTDEGFAAAAKLLDTTHVPDEALDARLRAAQALVDTTAAQALLDAAAAAEPGKPEGAQLRAEADRRVVRAGRLARDAAARSPTDPEVAVALADVLRLEKKPTAEVEKALGLAGDRPAALHVRALLRLRDGKPAEATDLFERALAGEAREGAELLRARYQLALLAAAAKRPDAAKKQVEVILAAQPGHARALALRARLDAAVAEPAVAAKPVEPPAPPSGGQPGERPGNPGAKPPEDVGAGPITAAAYDGLVTRGNKLAENGDCASAMKTFERALDARPGGVEALTGLGYCYLDRKQYSQALSNFRAALGISSRYSEALMGMAEAYRYQGMAQEALGYYRRYLEASPGGPKAAMARRQIEALGGTETAPKPETPVTAPPSPPPVVPPPIDRLPDKPGAPAETRPAAPPADDKPPDRPAPAKPEAPAEPPPAPAAPAERPGEPTPPDSPH